MSPDFTAERRGEHAHDALGHDRVRDYSENRLSDAVGYTPKVFRAILIQSARSSRLRRILAGKVCITPRFSASIRTGIRL
jgi:hypothetical protein